MLKDEEKTRKISVTYLRELDSLIHKKLYKLIKEETLKKWSKDVHI